MTKGYRSFVFTANNWTPEHEAKIQKQLNAGRFLYVIYGKEEAPTTGTPHLQGYLWSNEERIVQNVASLLRPKGGPGVDVRTPGPNQPPSYWIDDDGVHEIGYCKKGGDWVEFGERPTDEEHMVTVKSMGQGHRTDFDETAEIIEEEGLYGLALRKPEMIIKFPGGVKLLAQLLKIPINYPKFQLDEFFAEPIKDWSKCHIFWGPAKTGKTQFALAHFERPLLVRQIDRLKKFNPDVHDGIVFDDMSFLHFPRESQIHILDTEEESDIHCRYENTAIPEGFPRIFCTNNLNGYIFDFNDKNTKEEDDAITRRVIITHVPTDIRIPEEEKTKKKPKEKVTDYFDKAKKGGKAVKATKKKQEAE